MKLSEPKEKLPMCLAPFIGLFKISQRTSPCCEMWGETRKMPFDEYWNGDVAKQTRKALWEHNYDALPEGCKTCLNSPTSHSKFYLLEDRPFFVENFLKYKHLYNEDGSMSGVPLTQLALGVSNKCNMACRMCTPQISSTKLSITERIGLTNDPGILPPFDRKTFVAETDHEEDLRIITSNYETLREVVLHGGDPIQAKNFPAIIDALMPIKDTCKINFLSNGSFSTMTDGRNVWDVLKDFKDVHAVFSIDSIPEANDYIRLRGRTKRTMKIIDEALSKLPERHYVGVHTTLSNYSAVYFAEYLEWAYENLHPRGIWPSLNVVNNPKYYQPFQLPDDVKREVLKKLRNVKIDNEHYMELRDTAMRAIFAGKFSPSEWNKAMYLDRTIDEHEGRDMLNVFPMFAPHVNNIIPCSVDTL